jgi:hypothetical protein
LDPYLLWARREENGRGFGSLFLICGWREKKEKKGWGEKMKKRTVIIYASGPKRAANHLNQASHTPGGRAVVLHPNGAAAKYYRYMERKGGCGS